jgi:hypothetical protein
MPFRGTAGTIIYSFRVWIQGGNTGNIWFTCDNLYWLGYASVGAENADSSLGDFY